jgi:hypothetical protein
MSVSDSVRSEAVGTRGRSGRFQLRLENAESGESADSGEGVREASGQVVGDMQEHGKPNAFANISEKAAFFARLASTR